MKPGNGLYWKIRKKKLLEKFENLSYDDLDFKIGEEKAMIDILSVKLGKSNQELLNLIISL
jgi:hypothetical protein